MRTQSLQADQVERRWHVIDATDVPLGRLATRIATVLRGKHRPTFTPNADVGDFVIVVNAEKIRLTGNKMNDKLYQTHSGIPGGFKAEPYRLLLQRRPEIAVEKAVRGMLPKTNLGRTRQRSTAAPTGPASARTRSPACSSRPARGR